MMKWIKLHTDIITSTIVEEVGASGVGTWSLILSMAGRHEPPGRFKYRDPAHLARLFNMPVEQLEAHLKIFVETSRIKIRKIKEGFLLFVVNWGKYQADIMGKVDVQKSEKKAKVDARALVSSSLLSSSSREDNLDSKRASREARSSSSKPEEGRKIKTEDTAARPPDPDSGRGLPAGQYYEEDEWLTCEKCGEIFGSKNPVEKLCKQCRVEEIG
jgi:hypothetical protein